MVLRRETTLSIRLAITILWALCVAGCDIADITYLVCEHLLDEPRPPFPDPSYVTEHGDDRITFTYACGDYEEWLSVTYVRDDSLCGVWHEVEWSSAPCD
jgi:hypothetical protein